MNSLRSAGNFLSSKGKGHSAQAKKEANKSVAKDPNVNADTRLRAGFRSIGNRFSEHSHKREADVHKNAMKHNY